MPTGTDLQSNCRLPSKFAIVNYITMFYCAANDTNRRVGRFFSITVALNIYIYILNNYFLHFLVLCVWIFTIDFKHLDNFFYSNALSSSSEPCLKRQVSA